MLVVPMLDGWWSKRERRKDGVSPELAAAHFASTQLQSRFPTLGEDTKKLIATHLCVRHQRYKSNSNS